MKKKSILSILICLTLIFSMVALASCSSTPETLEEYVASNEDAMDEINEAADSAGLDVTISGNDIIYSYDIANYDGITEEVAKSDTMVDSLQSALESADSTFSGICEDLEEESSIEGIRIIVNYTYGDENLVSMTFDKSGIVE